MKNKVGLIIFILVIVAGVIAGASFIAGSTKTTGAYSALIECMKDKGVKFYGAFWCPHCQEQEKWLAASRESLESTGLYVECSTADAKDQTQICKDNNIKSYPTWIFPDGTQHAGEIKVEDLATQTNCPLQNPTSAPTPAQ